jgi:UDP-N-acetylmuramoyl-L-alanyl-D-glutamate--2,6-diaminopimelate ligase
VNATVAGDLRPEHPAGRPLTALASEFAFPARGLLDGVETTGVSIDTGTLRSGDLYVAAAGRHSHGARYLPRAREAGAVGVLTDPSNADAAVSLGLPVLLTPDPRAVAGDVAAWIYRTNDFPLTKYAVTGTNGKTSVVYLLSALLTQLGVANGLSSTAERRAGRGRAASRLTTPEAGELHALLARMREEAARAAAIEVSAQALTQHRVDGIVFDVAGFTNLGHDHLDEFGDLETYFAAKRALFQPERSRRAVVVIDTEWGRRIADDARIPVATLSSSPASDAAWHVTVTDESLRGVAIVLEGPGGSTLTTTIPIPGAHMGVNAALAIAMLVESGTSLDAIGHVLARDGGIHVQVPGRLERVSGPRGPVFFVDYAHTPEAYRTTLADLRRVTTGKLITILGGSGDRDLAKRPVNGAETARGSDIVIVTDQDPRSEDPAAIRAAVIDGARRARPEVELYEVPDVPQAVRKAISLASERDVILFATPAHSDHREVNGRHVPYSAHDDSRAALREAGWPA